MKRLEIKTDVPFLTDEAIEAKAERLIDRYSREIAPIVASPVPVERIADFLLELSIDWSPIADTDNEPILALIDPSERAIRLNENRKEHFDQYFGSLAFTYAHEIGHHELHLTQGGIIQNQFEEIGCQQYLCRMKKRDRREIQANLFAGFLLMPTRMILTAQESYDFKKWSNLYQLSEQFSVSITALTRRLTDMGLVYIKNKVIYFSEAEANGQLSMI
ncbi:MAG: ImmA/IrrE family metallo-endopeptidase [Deltaproteobacteria bacterium]|nr:ImmA/IrrE family metallo-endopeptidase [Deltaproteobacteria bacterium]